METRWMLKDKRAYTMDYRIDGVVWGRVAAQEQPNGTPGYKGYVGGPGDEPMKDCARSGDLGFTMHAVEQAAQRLFREAGETA